jgi:hypothetical protein
MRHPPPTDLPFGISWLGSQRWGAVTGDEGLRFKSGPDVSVPEDIVLQDAQEILRIRFVAS